MIGGFRETLWLFDIDGTLVDTGGAGMKALQEAAEEVFGEPGPTLDLAGSTDLGLVAGMFRHFGQEPSAAGEGRFFEVYLGRLKVNLGAGAFEGTLLPGVVEVLDCLAGFEAVTVGLLTGNIESGARAKVEYYGIGHHFGFGAYGCDHADRNRLGPVALERAKAHSGREFRPDEVLVIGDTPKDVACAEAMGARCLAVTTGQFDREALIGCGADVVLPDLGQLLD